MRSEKYICLINQSLIVDSAISHRTINWRRISWHVAFWIFYLGIYTFAFGYPNRYLHMLKGNLVTLPFDMFAVYFTIYFLLPRYLAQKKYGLFLLWFFVSAFLIVFIELFYAMQTGHLDKQWDLLTFILVFITWFVYIYLFVFLAAIIKLSKNWYQNIKNTQKLGKEKLQTELKLREAELKLLKAQNHPHFLFNTLNNLYGLTLEKSEKAPEVVLKLSAILDYMLYDCNEPRVPLAKEIRHIENYIALEKLRYDDTLDIDFDVRGEVQRQMIAPLLLLPFVENSFKHGTSSLLNNPWIKIRLAMNTNILNFHISNSKVPDEGSSPSSYKEGIGLKNVTERIEKTYPDGYMLNIDDQPDRFSVNLELTLEPNNP
ncbi:MAG: histidine kinase [Bacteroidetes bacterium]|nr:histidine kinase [Bacteroidota bacterium]